MILSLNNKAGIGVIKDSNDQHILFYIEQQIASFKRGQVVYFEIKYLEGVLRAVNVTVIIDGRIYDKNDKQG